MDWYVLVWGKSKPGAHQAQEGDIIDVLPTTILDKWGREVEREWRPNNKETQLCLIVPVSDLSREEAMALKESGVIMKRRYKMNLEDISKESSINISDVRDDEKYYQPLLEKSVKIDLNKTSLVKDKTDLKVRKAEILQ